MSIFADYDICWIGKNCRFFYFIKKEWNELANKQRKLKKLQQSKARDNFDDMQYNNVHKQSQSQISAFLLQFSSRNKESSGTFYNNTEQNGIFENLNLKYVSVEQQNKLKWLL